MTGSLQKRTPYRNKAILKSAEGEDCTMESPGCWYNPETVCFRHLNGALGAIAGKGKGQKADDCAGFYGCQGCENWYISGYLDEEKHSSIIKFNRDQYAFRAVLRTWRRLLDKGVLK